MVIKIARPKKDLNSLSAKVRENKKAQQTKVQGVFTCRECGEEKDSSEFYQSYGTKINVTHICKQCVIDGCLDDDGEYDLVLFQDMLRKLDKPFLNQIYITTVTKCNGSADSIVGTYMKNIHMAQYRGLTFANSDFGKIEDAIKSKEELEDGLNSREQEKRARDKIEKASKGNKLNASRRGELIDIWGKYSDELLIRFEKKFAKISKSYNILTELHMESLVDYVRLQVLYEYNLENDNALQAEKFKKLADEAKKNGKLNVLQMKKEDLVVGGVDSFAQISELVAKRDGLINIPMVYLKKPQDILDYQILENVNYMRASLNMPELTYEDINSIYIERINKFNERYSADVMSNDFGSWGE